MKKISILMACLASLLLLMRPVFAEEQKTLHWVGCGISKKAYLTALAAAYEKKTGVKIDIQGGGATRGIRSVADGSADIGGSCRRKMRIKEERGANMVPVAWDALVVIVHKDNPVDNITLDDLRKVFKGEITNWKQLGGRDAELKLFARQSKNSGVGRTARKLLFSNYDQEFAAHTMFKSSGPLEQAVVADLDAVAISGISSARKRDVKILSLEGKQPTYDNVKTGEYLLYRPLYLVYNDNSPNAETIKDFIKFADSAEGRDVIRANGTVPYLEGLNLMKKKMQEARAARKGQGLQSSAK